MRCPRCLFALEPHRHASAGAATDVQRCARCTGCWLESADLKNLEQVVDVRLLEWRHVPGIAAQGRILFCPRCTPPRPMDKVISTRDQRVVMDACPVCQGVWLDHGELEAIEQKGLLAAVADFVQFLRKT